MSIPVLTFFNNKGGVGKTSLVYHLAWMFSERMNILTADLDPQANLTSAFLDEDRIEEVWTDKQTFVSAINPLYEGTGDIAPAHIEPIRDRLGLIAGDLTLAKYEDTLSDAWPRCLSGDPRSFRVISSFWRILQEAAQKQEADLILIDVGPNLGAINRTALIASDYVVVPMAPDLFSLQGLRNLGPTAKTWREDWSERLRKKPDIDLLLPEGKMQVLGYMITQHRERLDRPTKAYRNFSDQFPGAYRECVLGNSSELSIVPQDDNNFLGFIKHYNSLMPMAQEARKPIYQLTPADGAIGSHSNTVRDAYALFKEIADKLLKEMNITIEEDED